MSKAGILRGKHSPKGRPKAPSEKRELQALRIWRGDSTSLGARLFEREADPTRAPEGEGGLRKVPTGCGFGDGRLSRHALARPEC